MIKKNLYHIKETSLNQLFKRVENGEFREYLKINTDMYGIKEIKAIKTFFWEKWDITADMQSQLLPSYIPILEYDFKIDFSRIEIGKIIRKSGLFFYPHFDGKIYFQRKVKFNGTLFKKAVDFENIEFCEDIEFNESTFEEKIEFSKTIMKGNSYFYKTKFKKEVFFFDVEFDKDVIFECAKFEDPTDYNAAFIDSKFKGESNFRNTFFKGKVEFRAEFEMFADFEGSEFEGVACFDSLKFHNKMDFKKNISLLSFKDNRFLNELILKNIYFENSLLINLEGCAVENKIVLNLRNDNYDLYKSLTLNLYGANIKRLQCDDKAFENIQLYWKNPSKDDIDSLKVDKVDRRAAVIKHYMYELRVIRKIFQDLLWGSIADEYYAKLMDQQAYLEVMESWINIKNSWKNVRNNFSYLHLINSLISFIRFLILLTSNILLIIRLIVKLILYKHSVGWGVRFGHIIISGLIAIISFTVYYWKEGNISYNIGHITMQNNNFLDALFFSIWNFFGIFLPDPQIISAKSIISLWVITGEAVLGIVWITLFVVILSRKFMRL